MVKKHSKNPKSKHSLTMEGTLPNSSWSATNLLDNRDNCRSTMKEKTLAEAKLLFNGNPVLLLPPSGELADWHRSGWICLYYYPFSIGMTFPFSKLVLEVLDALHVSPGQLMPFAWRTLACLDAIEEKHQLGIDANVIKFNYTIKKFGNCRFSFVNRNKDELLILNNETVNDRGWKAEFFFAEIVSLGTEAQSLLEKWNVTDISFDLEEDNVKAKEITTKIMALPVADRLWPNCLNRAIKNATIVNVEDYSAKLKRTISRTEGGTSDVAGATGAAARTRSKSFTPIVKPSLSIQSVSSESKESPKPLNEIEMSSGMKYAREFKPPILKPLIVCSKDLFNKRSRDEKSTETETSKAPLFSSPISCSANKKAKMLLTSTSDLGIGSQFSPLVSNSYDIHAKPSTFSHLLDDMLLPQSVEGLHSKSVEDMIGDSKGHIYHGFQCVMVAQEAYLNELKKFKELREEHGKCGEKINYALGLAADNLQAAKNVQKEFDDFAVKVQSMEACMRDEAAKIATQQIMRTCVEMMLEYSRGEWKAWDVDETVRIYNEQYPEDAFSLVAATGNDGVELPQDDGVDVLKDDVGEIK